MLRSFQAVLIATLLFALPLRAEVVGTTYSVDLGIQRGMQQLAAHLAYFAKSTTNQELKQRSLLYVFARAVTIKKMLNEMHAEMHSLINEYGISRELYGKKYEPLAGSDIRLALRAIDIKLKNLGSNTTTLDAEKLTEMVLELSEEISKRFDGAKIQTLKRGILAGLFGKFSFREGPAINVERYEPAYKATTKIFKDSINGLKLAENSEKMNSTYITLDFIKVIGKRMPGESMAYFSEFWMGVESVTNDYLAALNTEREEVIELFQSNRNANQYGIQVSHLNQKLNKRAIDSRDFESEEAMALAKRKSTMIGRLQELFKPGSLCEAIATEASIVQK